MASYTLHIQYVDRPAETRTFTQAKVTLGRDSGDIVLHDTQVSGKHGEIIFDGNTLRYTDVGSTNGSFLLQGQRVANIELTPGIALRLGNSLITVQIIDVPNVAGKGRTVIAGPGMVPGFPAPSRPPGPAAPGAASLSASGSAIPRPGMPAPPSPPPGGFAFAPTAQMQSPVMPAGMPGAPAPQPGFVPQPAPLPNVAQPAPMAPPRPSMAPPQPAPMAPPQPVAPAPLPVPAPPGTLSGGAPQAVPAAPVMAAPPAAAMAPAPTAAIYDTDGEPDAPTDFVTGLRNAALGAWGGIKDHFIEAVLITLIVGLPVALLSWLVMVFLGPASTLGGLIMILLRLAQLAGMLIVTPALARFVLGVHLGQPIGWQAAIQEQVADAKTVALNFLVFGVIGGVAAVFLIAPMLFAIAFIGPIYFVEGKRMLDAVTRNFEMVKRDWIPVVAHVLILAVVGALAFMVPAILFAYIPLIGSLIGVILAAVGGAALTAVLMMLLTQMYFANRRRFEGGDPESDARVRLSAAQLPAA